MSHIFIINGHQPYPFSSGSLNETFTDKAESFFRGAGHDVHVTRTASPYDVETEVTHHQWADLIFMQFPVNWMSVPWSFKKYMDEVYSAGMDGRLCDGDGRTSSHPKANYGMGGALTDTRYSLSATLNAPAEAFDDPSEPFFSGASLDELLRPVHLNAKFFGMTALESFGAFDVMKNPDIEGDLNRFEKHLKRLLSTLPA